MLKCKICRKSFRSLPAMAAHYRKKHPSRMKVHKRARKEKSEDVKMLLKKLIAKL